MSAPGPARPSPVGPPPSSLRERVSAPLVLAGALVTASVLLHLRDPHRAGSYLFCPWLLLTGTYCPGCGGLRAVNDLTHGRLLSAASSNLLLVGALPLAAVLWGRWLVDRWRGVRRSVEPRRAVTLAVAGGLLAAGFAVVRNLPAGAWLAP